MRDLEPEAAVGEAEDLVGPGAVASGIGDDDDLELEALGGVDREQPHGVGAFLLRHGVELPGTCGSCSATKRTKPSMSGPRSSSYDRARRASLRRFA